VGHLIASEPLRDAPAGRTRKASFLRFRIVPTLSRYLFCELLGTLALAFVVVMGLMFLVLALEAERRVGLDATSMLHLVPLSLPIGLVYAAPLSLLLAVAFTFNRLSADNELTAVRAAASTLRPFLAPVILVALVFSFGLLAVNMIWLPRAHQSKRTFLKEASLDILENLPPGDFRFHKGAFTLSYGDAQGRRLSDLYISMIRKDRLQLKILAREARWAFDEQANVLHLELEGSQWTWLEGEAGKEEKVYPGVVPFSIHLDDFYGPRPRRVEDYTFSELIGMKDGLQGAVSGKEPWFRWDRTELDYEIHLRLASSFSPLIMVLLGMPLGAKVRHRGKLVAFFIAFLPVVLLYYPLVLAGEGLGRAGQMPPFLAAWGADGVAGLLGAVLTWRLNVR